MGIGAQAEGPVKCVVAVSLGATQGHSKEPVERTVAEYDRPRPNTREVMCKFGSVCERVVMI